MIASQQSYKEVLRRLRKRYKKSPTDFVHWSNPLELIMGTVLSAQCTDKRVNQVTRVLFKRYKTAAAYAQADLVKLKQIVRSTGFYNSKARYLKGIGTILVRDHGGNVPADYDALMQLPGVSNKTANLIMAKAFGINVGVAVDTHVKRIAPRIGWVTKTENTAKIMRLTKVQFYTLTDEEKAALASQTAPLRDAAAKGLHKAFYAGLIKTRDAYRAQKKD